MLVFSLAGAPLSVSYDATWVVNLFTAIHLEVSLKPIQRALQVSLIMDDTVLLPTLKLTDSDSCEFDNHSPGGIGSLLLQGFF